MADIEVKRREAAPMASREWDPFRVMRELMRWDPFTESPFALGPSGYAPAFDVKETKEAFVFKADLPGMKPEDLDVKLTQNRLTLSGKREEEKRDQGDTFYTYERSHGTFTRSFTLPEGVEADKIHAELKDGVLTVMLPKKPEMLPRQVSVKKS